METQPKQKKTTTLENLAQKPSTREINHQTRLGYFKTATDQGRIIEQCKLF